MKYIPDLGTNMNQKIRLIIALLFNFFIVGSGFVLYNKFWIGILYLIIFVLFRFFQERIGGIWQILILVASYVHLVRVIIKENRHK